MKFKFFLRVIIVCALCANTHSINAQTDTLSNTIVLEKQDIQDIRHRYKLKFEEFQQYLSDIVNTNLTQLQRKESIQAALDLFIGKGKSYYVKNIDGLLEYKDPVIIQITGQDHARMQLYTVEKFLLSLYDNPNKFGLIDFPSVIIPPIEPLITKIDDNLYRGIGYSIPHQTSYEDNSHKYRDACTSKKIEVFLTAIETPIGLVWDMPLGDLQILSSIKEF